MFLQRVFVSTGMSCTFLKRGDTLQDKVDFLLEDAYKVKTFKAEGKSSTYVT